MLRVEGRREHRSLRRGASQRQKKYQRKKMSRPRSIEREGKSCPVCREKLFTRLPTRISRTRPCAQIYIGYSSIGPFFFFFSLVFLSTFFLVSRFSWSSHRSRVRAATVEERGTLVEQLPTSCRSPRALCGHIIGTFSLGTRMRKFLGRRADSRCVLECSIALFPSLCVPKRHCKV